MILRINDRIRNRRVEFFNQFALSLRYDSVASSFSFSAYFNPDNQEHIDLYCVGHYHLCTVEHNNELLLTGYLLTEGFNDSAERQLVSIGGYSLPGVLEDCKIPPSYYPLQTEGLSLRQIVQKYLAPFRLKFIVDATVASDMDKIYDSTTANESQSIKDFFTQLAAQRNIIMTHTERGELLFTRAKTKQTPILNYGEGIPFTRMGLSFNGQSMHSHITVMKQADADGGNAGETEIINPYVPYVFRPEVITQSSGDDNDTPEAAKRALAAELKNLKLTIQTDRWDINGKIIKPNNLVTVINPRVYLFKKTTWFIEQVDYRGDSEKLTATLQCVLPEVYSGETPQNIFAGINLH